MDISSINDILTAAAYASMLGVAAYLSYSLIRGFFNPAYFFNLILYFGAFAVGVELLKTSISHRHVLSFETTGVVMHGSVYTVGPFLFNFHFMATLAESISTAISTSSAGAATATLAVLYAGLNLHARLITSSWKGPSEVLEAFILGVTAFFCLGYYDIFYAALTQFLDSSINTLFSTDPIISYNETISPIMNANRELIKNIQNFNFFTAFMNLIAATMAGISMIGLLLLDSINFLLYTLQYLGLIFLPITIILMGFISGLDPIRPIKLCAVFSLITLLAKVQIILMAILCSSFYSSGENPKTTFSAVLNQLKIGDALIFDNMALILKVLGVLVIAILLIYAFSTKVFIKALELVAMQQILPSFIGGKKGMRMFSGRDG
jgi:hypothetical protein